MGNAFLNLICCLVMTYKKGVAGHSFFSSEQ